MKHLGFIKTFMFGLVGLVLCLMGCNHSPKSEEQPAKIIITIDGDNLKAGKGDKIEVNKGSTWLTVKNNPKITGVKFTDGYALDMWKLDSATGDALTDVYAFQENKTVFATSKSTKPAKITITIDGENIKVGKEETIEVDKGSTWLTVKNNEKITGVKFNDDYALEMWKLDSATGDALTDAYAFQENKTVFATSKSTKPAKIIITIDGENIKVGKGETIEVDKGSTWLTVKNNVKITGVKFNDDYALEMWKLDSATGNALTDTYAFQENKIVFATSKSIFKTSYDADEDILSVIGYTCEKEELPENLVIPNILDGKPVKAIGEEAFKACNKIKKLDISNCKDFLLLDVGAFQECENLSTVILPASIMAINTNVFMNCKKLTTVDFSKCTALTNLAGFTGCEGLTSLDLSNCTALEHIEYEAFRDCTNISGTVKLPNSLQDITFNSFKGCKKIEAIDLSNCKSLTTIDDQIFYGCISSVITLPTSITKFGSKAFGENEYLVKNIRIPNGVEGDKVKELLITAPCNYPSDRIERF